MECVRTKDGMTLNLSEVEAKTILSSIMENSKPVLRGQKKDSDAVVRQKYQVLGLIAEALDALEKPFEGE